MPNNKRKSKVGMGRRYSARMSPLRGGRRKPGRSISGRGTRGGAPGSRPFARPSGIRGRGPGGRFNRMGKVGIGSGRSRSSRTRRPSRSGIRRPSVNQLGDTMIVPGSQNGLFGQWSMKTPGHDDIQKRSGWWARAGGDGSPTINGPRSKTIYERSKAPGSRRP